MNEDSKRNAVIDAARRAGRAVAPRLEPRLQEVYGPDWLMAVNVRRESEGRLPGRGLDDERFVLALLGHDPACVDWADEGWRSHARRLLSLANSAHHGAVMPPEEAATALAVADSFCTAWGEAGLDERLERFCAASSDLDPEEARELVDLLFQNRRWGDCMTVAYALHLGRVAREANEAAAGAAQGGGTDEEWVTGATAGADLCRIAGEERAKTIVREQARVLDSTHLADFMKDVASATGDDELADQARRMMDRSNAQLKADMARVEQVVEELKRLDGPWVGRLGTTIKEFEFNFSLRKPLSRPPLDRLGGVYAAEIINAYWTAIANVLPEPFRGDPTDYVIQRRKSVYAFHGMLPDVLNLVSESGEALDDPAAYGPWLKRLRDLGGELVASDGSTVVRTGVDFWRVGSVVDRSLSYDGYPSELSDFLQGALLGSSTDE